MEIRTTHVDNYSPGAVLSDLLKDSLENELTLKEVEF